MYASTVRNHDYAVQCRFLARLTAATLFVIWVAYVIAEAINGRTAGYASATYFQAAALAVVFAGYAIGWRKELVGGLVTIIGTAAFFLIQALTLDTPGDPNMAWFAVPGVLYLLARHYDRAQRRPSP